MNSVHYTRAFEVACSDVKIKLAICLWREMPDMSKKAISSEVLKLFRNYLQCHRDITGSDEYFLDMEYTHKIEDERIRAKEKEEL